MANAGRTAHNTRWQAQLVGGALLFALAALLWTRAAPFAAAFALFAFLSAGGSSAPTARRWVALAAGALSLLAVARFAAVEALPGIVESGKRASGENALSLLRQLLFSQDVLREQAELDHDGDRIGSAGLIEELSGRTALRGTSRRLAAPMAMARGGKMLALPHGPCLELEGYCFMVCLPSAKGGWITDPKAAGDIDEERAERRFLAYAWPAQAEAALSRSYFIDEHERILVHESQPPDAYAGARSPRCDAALLHAKRWHPWRGKQARATLPGDKGQ